MPPKTLCDPNSGYQVRTRKQNRKQDQSLEKNLVSISLQRVPTVLTIAGEEGKFVIIVSVFSTHKKGLRAYREVDPGHCASKEEVFYQVEVAAGAAAEHLAEMYGDVLDPDWCVKQAKELFIDVMKKYAELLRQGKTLVSHP